MRTIGLGEQIVQAARVNRGIVLPSGQRTTRKWPICLTCLGEVDAVEMRNINTKSVEIVAKCSHKSSEENPKMFEDSIKVLFPVRLEGDPFRNERNNWQFQRALHDFCPFRVDHAESHSRKG